ncbi:MAG TPA: DUF4446 family protein [Nocardioidaceae bacterium]|nr:DUF4446 family protein [Nocardioidaceae bacterium]
MSFSDSALTWLTLSALALGALGLGVGLAALAAARRRGPGVARRPRRGRSGNDQTPLTTAEVTAELGALNAVVATSLRHLAVVRYDAFGDMGGHLSWSMALLDDLGDGVVLTSIHGRSESRTYAKNVSAWAASQQLSPEEEEAIGFARSAQAS